MFGSDEPLLAIRAKVLNTIACETNILYSGEQARQELTSAGAKPELILICHTADEDGANQVRSLALQVGVPTYYVERLVPPEQLVRDVRRLLKQESQPRRAVAGGI
jgi:hypothetical protein